MEIPANVNTSLQDLIEYIKQGLDEDVKFVLKNQPKAKTSKMVVPLAKAAVQQDNKNILLTLLSEYGLNANNALDIVINDGTEDLIDTVIDRGADVNEGLYFAVKANKKDFIMLLLDRRANINTDKRNKTTPLHTAITQKCDVGLVEFLINNGADTQVKTKNNKTALDLVQNFLAGKNDLKTRENLEKIQNLLMKSKNDNVFECIQGLPDGLSGYTYQIKLFALYAIKNTKMSMTRGCQYELATEAKNLIPFDDIFLRKLEQERQTCEYVQVKQTKKPETNKIHQSKFFTMLKSAKNMKEYIKGNDSIIKMFMKFDEITSNLGKDIDTEFIYCTNTHFHDVSKPCFLLSSGIKDKLLCGVKHDKWIVDPFYLYMEIQYVLLNLMQVSQQMQLIMNEEFQCLLHEQVETIDDFIKKEDLHKNTDTDILWSVQNIANEGINIIQKRLILLENCKKQIKNATNTEMVRKNLPKDCEIFDTEDLAILITRAVAKINELYNSLKIDKETFMYFSKYEEVEIRKKISKFAKHFSVYTDCPTSDELYDILTEEISKEFKFDFPKLISAYCLQHFSKWISDFKNEEGRSFTDKDGKKLFSNIWIQLFNELNKSYSEEIQRVDIKFQVDNEQVKNFLNNSNNNKILHIVTQNTRLHVIQIFLTVKKLKTQSPNLDYFNNVLFTSSEHISKSGDNLKNIFEAFNLNESNYLLVLECLDDINDFQKVFEISDELRNIINSVRKKLILISKCNNRLATAMKCVFKNHMTHENIIKFEDLTQETQELILEKNVNFQNNPNSIKTNLKISDFIAMCTAGEVIDEGIISEIINNTDDVQFGNSEAFISDGYNKYFFIQRHLLYIDIRILKNYNKQLFFITGISREELTSKCLVEEPFIHVWQKGKLYDKGIVLMSYSGENTNRMGEEVFTSLSSKSKNCFWLEFRGDSIYRKDKNLDNASIFEEMLLEFKLVPGNIEDHVVIVANSPGEGKSTMLTDLAHSIRINSPKAWIIRVDLRKYADITLPFSLHNITFDADDTTKAVELITLMVVKDNSTDTSTRLERKLLHGVLNGQGRMGVVLLFDGYDEISPGFKEKTCILLKALAKSYVKQLWVTTRVHLREYLEEQLQVPAYMLATFTDDEQAQFVSKFWGWHLKNYKCAANDKEITEDNTKLDIINHIKVFLKSFQMNTANYFNESFPVLEQGSLIKLQEFIDSKMQLEEFAKLTLTIWRRSIKKKDFLTAPLNLEMLAKNTIQSEWKNITNMKNVQLFQIYTDFVENKLEVYEKLSPHSGNQANRDQADIAAVIFREMHREVAVRTLFEPPPTLPDLNICNKHQNFLESLVRIGLVKSYGNHFEFVHRSFAEYFFSEYLKSHLDNPQVQSQFLGKIMVDNEYHLVRTFFDGFLSQLFSSMQFDNNYGPNIEENSLYKNILAYNVTQEIIQQKTTKNDNVLHIAVRGGFLQIFLLILNNITKSTYVDLIKENSAEGLSIFLLAITYGNTEMFNTVLESVKDLPKDSNMKIFIDTFFDIPKMIKDCAFKILVITFTGINLNTLRLTAERDISKICNLNEKHTEKCPFFTKLILECDKTQRTVLHISASTGQNNSCRMIINAAKKYSILDKLILKLDENNKTALHLAVLREDRELFDMILKSVEEYSDVRKNLLTQKDKNGQNVLHVSAMLGRADLCEAILKSAVMYTTTYKDIITQGDSLNCTALHIAATHDHLEVCETILKTVEQNTDAMQDLILRRNIQNQTVLHVATRFWHNQFCNVLLKCVEKYEDIFKDFLIQRNDNYQTTLHIATQWGEATTCNVILKTAEKYTDLLKVIIMLRDHNTETALHIAARLNDDAICYIILNYAAKHIDIFKDVLTQCDQFKRTALHIAAICGQRKACCVILESAKMYPKLIKLMISQCDKDGNTAFQLAELNGHKEFSNVFIATILRSNYALKIWQFKINMKTKVICKSIRHNKNKLRTHHNGSSARLIKANKPKEITDYISRVKTFTENRSSPNWYNHYGTTEPNRNFTFVKFGK